jgi:hypothetical protein
MNILETIKQNKAVAIAAGAILALFAIERISKPKRRRRRRTVSAASYPRRRTAARRPAAKRVYTKGGKAKKPWQVKGSLAAKRHMARLRKMR